LERDRRVRSIEGDAIDVIWCIAIRAHPVWLSAVRLTISTLSIKS